MMIRRRKREQETHEKSQMKWALSFLPILKEISEANAKTVYYNLCDE